MIRRREDAAIFCLQRVQRVLLFVHDTFELSVFRGVHLFFLLSQNAVPTVLYLTCNSRELSPLIYSTYGLIFFRFVGVTSEGGAGRVRPPCPFLT